jgi:uncharacterized caspase-like protein
LPPAITLAEAVIVASLRVICAHATGEGFFLLAASKPGEDSKERAELGHGAFTSALLAGLHGAADNDGDGLLPLSELFGYVAREVPRLTGVPNTRTTRWKAPISF